MSLLSTFCALIIGITFSYAGAIKLFIFNEFKLTLELIFKVPTAISKGVAVIIVFFELSLFPVLFFGSSGSFIYLFVSFIMCMFVCIPLYAMVTGKIIQCNCFGDDSTLKWQDLVRNLVLFLSSLILCVYPPSKTFNVQTIIIFFLAIATVNIMINLKSISSFLR